MPKPNPEYKDDYLAAKWDELIEIKGAVSKALEEARQAKVIGHALDAKVRIFAEGEDLSRLQSVEDDLAKLFIVSQLELHAGLEGRAPAAEAGVAVEVEPAAGAKCQRCWTYHEHLNEQGVCPRCARVLAERK